jgi:hypothetical protein
MDPRYKILNANRTIVLPEPKPETFLLQYYTRLRHIIKLLKRVKISIFGKDLSLKIDRDQANQYSDRIFIQVVYKAPCTKTGDEIEWKGRKWYLSNYMTDDEIIKTAYVAFEAAVKHEIMEGFKVDDKVLFNPHVNFEELLLISHKEVTR